jgi:hypothetical protein
MHGQETDRRGFDEAPPARLIAPATVGILAGLDEIDGLGKTGIHRRLFRPIIPARSDFVYARAVL